MDLLPEIIANMNSVINHLKYIEKPEYNKNITNEELVKERKNATEMLKSILRRKQDIIDYEKIISNK